jgi:hypothetical protein
MGLSYVMKGCGHEPSFGCVESPSLAHHSEAFAGGDVGGMQTYTYKNGNEWVISKSGTDKYVQWLSLPSWGSGRWAYLADA